MKQFVENLLHPIKCDPVPGKLETVFDNRTGKRHGPGRDGLRPVDAITTLCIHQTAVEYGVSKRQVKEADRKRSAQQQDLEPERVALHRRFFKVPYHVVVLRNHDVLYNNSFRRYTYHGNGCNSFTIGLAFEGKFPGTLWAADEIEVGKEALHFTVTLARELGHPITSVTSHRQWSGRRLNDPGLQIWHDVVVPAARDLDLKLDQRTGGTGQPRPLEWDFIR